jgi:hypothetical protein
MESAGAFDFSCAFGDGRLSLVNAGGCVGRSASKCLQAAVLEICVGEGRSRMEQLLWPSCQNSHGCGLGGSQVEAMNFWAVEGALHKAHCYLSVVEAQRRSDVRDGRGLTAWRMGATQGALLGTVAWVHHERHVFVVRGRQAPALVARLTQGASLDVSPWARGVVGAPKRRGSFTRSLAWRLSRESSEPMQPRPTESVGCSAAPSSPGKKRDRDEPNLPTSTELEAMGWLDLRRECARLRRLNVASVVYRERVGGKKVSVPPSEVRRRIVEALGQVGGADPLLAAQALGSGWSARLREVVAFKKANNG